MDPKKTDKELPKYWGGRQRVWRCPTCGFIHRGFTEDRCRNVHCADYLEKGAK